MGTCCSSTFYRTLPEGFIADIFVIVGPASWKNGKDWMAPIRKICTLENPLHWETMKADDRLKYSHFIRGQMRSRYRASAYWEVLLDLIVLDNPDLAWLQTQYGPVFHIRIGE
jgi:hypothetical protein